MPQAETARRLEHLAGDLHAVAFDYLDDARDIRAVDRRIAEVERICAEARAVVRGKA